jgi:hypothetical protein
MNIKNIQCVSRVQGPREQHDGYCSITPPMDYAYGAGVQTTAMSSLPMPPGASLVSLFHLHYGQLRTSVVLKP